MHSGAPSGQETFPVDVGVLDHPWGAAENSPTDEL